MNISGRSRAATLALALMTALTAGGCAALWIGAGAAAGAAGMAYVRGELRSNVNATPREVARAASDALETLGIHEISSSVSAVDARVIGRTAADRKVTIKTKVREEGESAVSIRVGVFGDEPLSRRIHQEMMRRLPAR